MVRFVNINLSKKINLNFLLKESSFNYLLCDTQEEKELFLKIVMKISPTKGDILIGRESILRCRDSKYRKNIKNMGIVFSDYKFISYKTVEENLLYYLKIRGYSVTKAEKVIGEGLKFFGITDKKNSEIRSLSHEEKIILGLTRAMLTEPKVLILDEIHLKTDKKIWKKIFSFLRQLNKKKTGILYLTCDDSFTKDNSKYLENIREGVL